MKTLLLNSNFQPLSFISDKRAVKLLIKNKADTLAIWNDIKYFYASGFIELPSVLRLKDRINRGAHTIIFSRNAVFKRDNSKCQYCGIIDSNNITVDHIIPRSRGGENTFDNCVAACNFCNTYKGSRTPNEAGMRLLRTPKNPTGYFIISPPKEYWHHMWSFFVDSN